MAHGGAILVLCAVVYSSTIAFFSLKLAAVSGAIRHKISALLITYFCIVFCFGAIYYAVFRYKADLYSFSPAITQGKAFESFGSDFQSILDVNRKLFFVILLQSNLSQTMTAQRNKLRGKVGIFKMKSNDNVFPLTDQYGVRFLEVFGNKTMHSYYIEIRSPSEIITIGGLNPFNKEVEAVMGVFLATTEDDLRTKLLKLIDTFLEQRSHLLKKLQNDVLLRPEWNYFDFCYFSAITMTTVGYGDILPNSGIVRLLVLLHSIIGVFFVGFALVFLWPHGHSGER